MPSATRSSFNFVLLILLAAVALVVWNGYSRHREFVSDQQRLIRQAVFAASDEIGLQLSELRRRVALFAEGEASWIARAAAEPDSDKARKALAGKLDQYFDERLAFTITRADGTPAIADFEGLIGETCYQEIHAFAQEGTLNEVYIHPQPNAYHFDIMTNWRDPADGEGVFFVSFRPALLARLLGNMQTPEHRLLLVNTRLPDLIEIAPEGSRDRLERPPHLTQHELSSIVYGEDIPGTRWRVVGLPHAALFEHQRGAIARETGLFVVSLILVTGFLLRFLRRSEERRFAAETALRRAHHELALRIKDRTQQLSETNAELRTEVVERKQAETTLREREAVLRGILETAADGIIVIDEDGLIQTFNDAAQAMFGYAREEVLGRNVNLLMPSPTHEEHDDYLRRYLETGEEHIIGVGREVRGLSKDGREVPLHLSVSAVELGHRRLFAGILRRLDTPEPPATG